MTMKETKEQEKGTRLRQQFDETYKRHAVELTLSPGRTIKAMAEELGITPWTLYRWRELYAPQPFGGSVDPGPRSLAEVEDENRQLRAEVIRLRERETVLKKSLGILSETPASGMPRLKR